MNGDAYDGVDPTFVPEVVASDGACMLYRSPTLFCASLVSQLVELGFTGFPAIDLTRRSADSVDVADLGCVELEVVAGARVDATLPGVTSCNSDEECEEGQTCQEDLTCSE